MKSRRKINKILTVMLIAIMAVALAVGSIGLYSYVASAEEVSPCYHVGHDEEEWQALTSSDAVDGYIVIAEDGKYYLEDDLEANILISSGTVTICLNGKTLTGTGVQTGWDFYGDDSLYRNDSVINVQEDAYVYLCDCSEEQTGTVTGEGCIYGVVCVNLGELDMYGGTLTGNKLVYVESDGVEQTKTRTPVAGGATVANGSFILYDGMITGNQASGGGVYVFGDDETEHTSYFEMNGGEITSNTGENSGGGVTVHDSNAQFVLNDGEISCNTSNRGGGLYLSDVGSRAVQIHGGKVSQNSAGKGGGIYLYSENTSSSIQNCVINGGEISYNEAEKGAGVYVEMGHVGFHSGCISHNEATGDGGGVYVEAGVSFYFEESSSDEAQQAEISYNKATNGGGFYGEDDSQILVRLQQGGSGSDFIIKGNEATEKGGGLYGRYGTSSNSSSSLKYTVEVTENSAKYGGGIYFDSLTDARTWASLDSSITVTNNSADYGGGIYLNMNSEEYYSIYAPIEENKANFDGGGIYVESGMLYLYGSSNDFVERNEASQNGGGIYLANSSSLYFRSGDNTSISNNKADGDGGGVYVENGFIDFNSHSGVIDGNEAGGCGGGIYVSNGDVSIEKSSSEIKGNKAGKSGAGIYLAGGSVTMSAGSISENIASEDGGGAYVVGGSFTMSGGTISSNEAGGKGGGVYMGIGTFNIQDAPIIADNKVKNDDGVDVNLYLTGDDVITVTGVLTGDALIYFAMDYERDNVSEPMIAKWSDNSYSVGILDHLVSENGYILHRSDDLMGVELLVIHDVRATLAYGGEILEIKLYDAHENEIEIDAESGFSSKYYLLIDDEYIEATDLSLVNVGDACYISVHVVASEDYTEFDSDKYLVTVQAKDIEGANITLGAALTYTAMEQQQTVTSVTIDGLEVTWKYVEGTNVGLDAVLKDDDGNYVLDSNGDYIVKEYTLTVEGTGNFTGYASTKFTIAQASLGNKEENGWIIEYTNTFIYDGNPHHSIVVNSYIYNDYVLVEGVDYDYDGKGTTKTDVTSSWTTSDNVIGLGNFCGSLGYGYKISARSISDTDDVQITYTQDPDALVYNGAEQRPVIVEFRVDGLSLVADTDYTLDGYATDVGEYAFTITGKKNFEGTITVSFTINQLDISEAEVELGDGLTYDGTEQEQSVSYVKVGELEITSDNYTVSGNRQTNPGSYTLTIQGTKNCCGEINVDFKISAKSIDAYEVVFKNNQSSFTYNGKSQYPEIESVTVDGSAMAEAEYTVVCEETINAGEYTLAIEFVGGDYLGNVLYVKYSIVALDIVGDDIEEGDIVINSGDALTLTYNGVYQMPEISISVKGLTLTYEVTSGDAGGIDVGDYSFEITGTGNFTGTIEVTFTINSKSIDGAEISLGSDQFTYSGSEQVFDISVVVDGLSATYEAVFYDGESVVTSIIDVGTYKAVVTGTGNFTGTVEKTFDVEPKSIEGADVTIERDHFIYDGDEHALIVTVMIDGLEATCELICYDGEGNEVHAVKAGTYTIIVTGIGNFTGSIEEILTIDKAIPVVDEPTGLTAERGDTLADVALPSGWAWDSYLDYQFDVSGSSYYFWATFTPDDTEDYETVTVRLKVVVASESQNDYGASLTIVEYPTQMEYTAFDTFDPDGIVLSIELEGGASITVEDASIFDHEITNGDSLTRDENGQCEIIITYYIPISYIEENMVSANSISLLADYEDHPEDYIALSIVFHVTVNKLTPEVHIETSDLAEGTSGDGLYSFADILTMSDGEVTYKFYTLVDGEYVKYEGDIYEAPTGTYYIKVFISETNNCEAAESDYYEFNIVEAPEPEEESDSVQTASIIATVVAGAVIVISLIVLIVYLTRKRKY